ncbi:MAG TPA: MarR family transcriptional regulator [Pseudonocardia sp.]|nr:MarR family transcriptional regulator [Pseudonocardia sp.]
MERTRGAGALTRLVLATFAANGAFLAAGDRLVARHGLTAARWQALGAVALAERPLTVAQIARRMGLARQSMHATVRRLVDDGLLELAANADHRRSPLVRLTPAGESAYAEADALQMRWADRLADGIDPADLEAAAGLLDGLCRRLEAADPHEEEPK